MTKVYDRLTTHATGHHLSPVAGSTGILDVVSGNDATSTDWISVRSSLYVVEPSGTETALCSNVASVEADSNTYDYSQFTNTGAIGSAGTFAAATVLKHVLNYGKGSRYTYTTNATFYSGPLVATGVSATTGTFSYNLKNDGGDTGAWAVGADYNLSYVDGITLTGTPTSIRLYLQNVAAVISPTVRGTWHDNPTYARGLGFKSGPMGSYSRTDDHTTLTTYGCVKLSSLPFVQAGSVTAASVCTGQRESNAAADCYARVCAFVSSSPTSVPSYTLFDGSGDGVSGTENSTSIGTAGRVLSTTVTASLAVGDVVLLELGFQSDTTATTYSTDVYFGNTGTDLGEGTDASSRPGWIELTLGSGTPATGAMQPINVWGT